MYNIASNPEYDGYQRGLASRVYKFFDKMSPAEPSAKHVMGSGIAKPNSLKRVAKDSSLILADELH